MELSDTAAIALWALVVLLWLNYTRLERAMRALEKLVELLNGEKKE